MSDSKFSLIDAGDWSKPVEKLIESISSAIGTIYEPTKIRRKAKADADALIIKRKAEIEADNISSRAQNRLNNKEIRRQKNIESIVDKSLKQLPESVSDKDVNEDWIYQFFNESQDISNDEMQFIWSKILANEVSEPGSFSFRTLNTVKLLTPEEASLFRRACQAIWTYDGEKKLVVAQNLGLSHKELIKLQASDLLTVNLWDGYGLYGQKQYVLSYFDEKVKVQVTEKDNYRLKFGLSALSIAGLELSSIVDVDKDEEYFNSVKNLWVNDYEYEVEDLTA